jgi:hypothetical protein
MKNFRHYSILGTARKGKTNLIPARFLSKFRLAAVALALIFVATSARAIPSWAESYGVGSYDTAGQPTGDPFYGSGFDYPTGIAKMPDGGFVVAGQLDLPRLYRNLYSSHTSGASDGSLVRFASDGTILWQITLHLDAGRFSNGYFSPAPSQIQYLATDAHGNIFVSGGKGNPDNGSLTPFVAKFASNGSLVWQNGLIKSAIAAGNPPQTFQTGLYSTTYMSLTSDGGVILSGSQTRPGSSTSVPFLAKFAGNGAVSFYRVYDQPNQYTEVGPVCQSPDGTKYFTAIRFPLTTNGVGSPSYGLGLIVFDASGNVLAQRGWTSLDGGNETMVAMIQAAGGGFAVLSARDDYSGFTVRKFNSTGSATTLERTVSRASNAPFNIRPLSLAETADGGLLIGISTGSDAGLIKIRTNGSVEFVTALGGPDNEGGPYSNGPSSTYGIATSDGGYALTCTTLSYYTGLTAAKPDWWVVKTDANRRIRNFSGTQVDESLSNVTISGSPHAPKSISYYLAPFNASVVSSTDPILNLIDLSGYELPDLPTFAIQASSPRIVSPDTAEAVVAQHFAYHTATAFFSTPAKVTFTAVGLPKGFLIDAHTGVISGAPAAGSETTQPIVITLKATDGTDTASLTLKVTIGDGVPAFTVNGSNQPTYPSPSATPVPGVADTVLTFLAREPGIVAGRTMRVEATTTPNVASSWTPLPSAAKGLMTYDVTTEQYFLSSNEYPHTQADPVYFRSIASAQARPDIVSNVVGPFNLTSNTARLGTTQLLFTGNGPLADLYFKALESATPKGIAVRVQSTTSPTVEQSWTDLPNGGTMTRTKDPAQFVLVPDKLPEAQGVYFRAIATASGYLDSRSNMVGPFDLTVVTPPSVTLTPPSGTGSGNTPADPRVVTIGSLHFHVTAQTDRSISQLALLVDGKTLYSVRDGTSFIDYITTAIDVGDHVVEALAIDDRRTTARAGTGAIYLRVKPAPAAAMAERAAANSVAAAASAGKTYTAVQDYFWAQASTWKDESGKSGVPGANDFAIIGDHNVVVDTAQITVKSVSIGSGEVMGGDPAASATRGSLTVSGAMTISGGATFDGNLDIVIGQGGMFEAFNSKNISFNALSQGAVRIYNAGNFILHGSGNLNNVDQFNQSASLLFLRALTTPTDAATNPNAGVRTLAANLVTGGGATDAVDLTFLLNDGNARLISGDSAGLIGSDSAGLIGSDSAGLIGHDSGSLVAAGGGNIVAAGGGNIVAAGGGNVVAAGGGNVVAAGGGNAIAAGGGNFVDAKGSNSNSLLTVQAAAASGGYVQNGGETNLSGISVVGPVTLNGGVLSGTGIIAGNLTNNGGYIAPGGVSSPGLLAITGNFTQGANGTLILDAAGGEPFQFDQIQVGGAAQLGGKLDLKTINGYVPLPNDPFNPLGYRSVKGSFSSVSSNAHVTATANGLVATLNPSAPSPRNGQPLNIATRLAVRGGDNVLIAGFIITGPSGSTKKVLIRGIGPSLAKFGVAGTISDPLLELHKPNGTVVTNDNWQQGNPSQIPNGFAPGDPRESVIVTTLSPGSYSAILKGAHGETGVGLAELYDLDPTSAAQLGNIATRGFVNTGDNVMIGGFIVGGTEPAKILVRAIGPSLTAFGVQGALPATTLELHDSNGAVISNDGWRHTQEAEIKATTIAPTNDKEAAILATLVPGSYTAVVRGKNNTTGIGLVEAYNLP